MENICCDVLVVGGGAAGMAAAASAAKAGASSLLVERESKLGGVLRQCLHRGFGRSYFGEELTGPEFAARLRQSVENVRVLRSATVLRLEPDRSALVSGADGLRRVRFERCVLATGSRERLPLFLAGTRPAGVFTAGTAQRLMNLGGYDIGREIVVLGSGDVGQIAARQLVQTGRRVTAIVEQQDRLGGLARNRRDCVEAYRIPVRLRSTIDEVLGIGRVAGVAVHDLETGRREVLPCDTLITALGLVPERELAPVQDGAYPDWLRFCGNCEKIYDLADTLTVRAAEVGKEAAT